MLPRISILSFTVFSTVFLISTAVMLSFHSVQQSNLKSLQNKIDVLNQGVERVQDPKDNMTLRKDIVMIEKDKTSIQNSIYTNMVQTIGGIAIGLTAYLSYRNLRVAEDKQVTERFAKAIEHLGSDKIDIRLGGIYALEQIPIDSLKYQWTVMEILSAFIRERVNKNITEKALQGADVKAALTVIGRRVTLNDANGKWSVNDKSIDLRMVNLEGVEFARKANFIRADFRGSMLSKVNLREAILIKANLAETDLTGASLVKAKLNSSVLIKANLSKTDLAGASLAGANLASANLDGADLKKCKGLTSEQIKEACYWERAFYPEGKLEELQQDKASDPKEAVDYSYWEKN